MSVQNDSLAVVRSTVAVSASVYTVPAGITALLKDVVASVSGAGASIIVTVSRGTVAVAVLLVNAVGLGGTIGTGHLVSFVVLEPGDVISWTVAGAAPIANLWASGAELQGLAP